MDKVSQPTLIRLVLFGLLSCTAFVLGFLVIDYDTGVSLIRISIYPVLLIAFTGFIVSGILLAIRYKGELRSVFISPAAIVTIIAITILTMVNQPLGYRTVMDEIVLAGTARQLHLDREPLTPNKALYGRNYLVVSNAYLDKRPVFFPFLVSLIHDATGYRAENAFYLNVFFTLLIFAIIWGIGFGVGGIWSAAFGTIMIGTLPLIPMLGSGGGFEMANLLWILLFYLGLWALFQRTDKVSVTFLVLTTILLAHLRYESALFVPFCGIAILWAWKSSRRIVAPIALILSPLFLLDIPLQHKVFQQNERFWQLEDVAGAESIFSFEYAPTNLGHALNYFLSTENYVPNTIPLAILGFVGLLFTALLLRVWCKDGPREKALVVLWLSLLLQTIILFTYFWGRLDDTIIHRLALPLWLFLWIGLIYLFKKPLSSHRYGAIITGVALLFWLTYSLPLYAKAEYSTRHAPPAVFNRMSEWAKKNQDGRTLVVSRNSLFWITENFAAMGASDPEEDLPFLKRILNHGIYSNMLVSEPTQFDPETNTYQPEEKDRVNDAIQKEEIFHYVVDRMYGFRVSRIVGVDYKIPEESLDNSTEMETYEDDYQKAPKLFFE